MLKSPANLYHKLASSPALALVCVLLAVGGCERPQLAEGIRSQEAVAVQNGSDQEYEEILEERRQKVANVAATFSLYEGFATSLSGASYLQLFEGLPHPDWESEVFKRELGSNKTVKMHGYHYYASPIELTEEDIVSLKSLYVDDRHLVPFTFYKSCGGYHADWCLVWNEGSKRVVASFCFSCGESLTSDGSQGMTCDINDIADLKRGLRYLSTISSSRRIADGWRGCFALLRKPPSLGGHGLVIRGGFPDGCAPATHWQPVIVMPPLRGFVL